MSRAHISLCLFLLLDIFCYSLACIDYGNVLSRCDGKIISYKFIAIDFSAIGGNCTCSIGSNFNGNLTFEWSVKSKSNDIGVHFSDVYSGQRWLPYEEIEGTHMTVINSYSTVKFAGALSSTDSKFCLVVHEQHVGAPTYLVRAYCGNSRFADGPDINSRNATTSITPVNSTRSEIENFLTILLTSLIGTCALGITILITVLLYKRFRKMKTPKDDMIATGNVYLELDFTETVNEQTRQYTSLKGDIRKDENYERYIEIIE